MYVKCERCGRTFNDEFKWTICPHRHLGESPDEKKEHAMREITTHRVNGCNDKLIIQPIDEPGAGGANHVYQIAGFLDKNDDSAVVLRFQDGPIAEVGTNGVTHEALLAIVIDRLECFQRGPYACRENAIALTKLQESVHWLKHRTEARLARGVEGTHAV